ncbi:MAG: hypothetical protein ACUVV6_04225 [Thermoplasmatota archaeon]
MPGWCERCGKRADELVPIDYSSPFVQYTEIHGAAYVSTDWVCLDCARVVHEMSEKDLGVVDGSSARELEARAGAFRDAVAILAVEAVLSAFGYDVHPCGPDRRVVRGLRAGRRKGFGETKARLAAAPELYAFDREAEDGRLLKVVPASLGPGEALWISRAFLSGVRSQWPEAELVVCALPELEIRCIALEAIDMEALTPELSPLTGRYHCRLDFGRDLRGLHEEFRRVDEVRWGALARRMRELTNFAFTPRPSGRERMDE